EFEALTTAIGEYALGAATGKLQLEFIKTGYTSALLEVNVEILGRIQTPSVSLWKLPISEGVYWNKNHRYFPTNHPRPNQYQIKDAGIAWGTPVNPKLSIPWVDSALDPNANPPYMIGHKLSPYDAHMHRLQRVKAAPLQGTATKSEEKMQYPEEIWIIEKQFPLHSKVLDEPEKLLVELRAAAALDPGVYAIHWGALEGYDSIDPRIFLFELTAPPQEAEEGEGEDAAEQME
ncbi:MAG: hypothetical protein KAH38_04345, partial [Candidatus Hydrogenedentes bacterium]|nr:hypothetical protein [Candidatus Hydrogenedentota bacterium]